MCMFAGISFILLTSCTLDKKSGGDFGLENRILSDPDFIVMVLSDEQIRREIVNGEFGVYKERIGIIYSRYSSVCDAIHTEAVTAEAYLRNYFFRACERQRAKDRFYANNPDFQKLPDDQQLQLRREVLKSTDPIDPRKVLERLITRNQ